MRQAHDAVAANRVTLNRVSLKDRPQTSSS